MYTVYKYPLEVADEQELTLPAFAKILCVKDQHNDLVLYALVNTDAELLDKYKIYIRGTGHPINFPPAADYLDTVVMFGGKLVWHIFIREEVI